MPDSEKEDLKLPEGLAFQLGMNIRAMENFSALNRKEKERVIEESRCVKSKSEMSQLVAKLVNSAK